jgi:hypothetical protein
VEGIEVANTLAYYETATFTAVKSFIVQAPVVTLVPSALIHQICFATFI